MSTDAHAVAPVRILVVEDEVIVARDICVQLAELGYTALADTGYGEEAIKLAEQHRPDLVLMDVNLAGAMDGITAAREIRASLDLPVVFLTAYANRETLDRAKEAQPFGYIIKPFAEEELRTVIEMALFKHHAEQKQRATDARYRALTETANDAIITIDREGLIVGWNQGATRIYGFTEDEAMGRPLMSLIVPARLHEDYAARMSRVMSNETQPGPGTLEAAGMRKDGSEFPVEMSLAQWDTKDGHFFTTIIRDITERKQLEQQMRLQSAALASAVNSVVITNAAGDIVWVNPAFCRITGYESSEVIGRNPRILKSGAHAPEFYAGMWQAIAAGQSWQGELVNRRKDGSLLNESVSITPVKDEGGRVTHFVAIKQDITALKQSLGELSATHAVLAEKNRALDAALVEARAAVEAKATFLATMSHEIRTPMNGVIGMASLLRETAPLTGEQADYIDTIRSSGETLLTLINDVLDFSKIESGNMELEQIPFDLRQCIEETLEMLAPRAREKRLDLAAEIESTVPPAIIGDAVRLRQVITNLVGNAVKFTEKGEVVIGVRATPAPGGFQRLFFRVRDTGIGIPPEKLRRLFKSFTQVDSSTTRVYGGSGLGLAISQRLVGLMGGTIEVESEPGRGSEFFFDLAVQPAPAIEPIDLAKLPADLSGRSVLIVDDNATNRRIFAAQLRLVRCITVEQATGIDALAWLKVHAWPDLIITDMLMPGMDGLDFILKVREMEKERAITPPVPVVMVSSGGYQPSDSRSTGARLAVALSKPLRQQQLLEAAARACALTPAMRTPRMSTPATDELRATAQHHPRRILVAEDNPVNRKVALAMLSRMGYEAEAVVNGAEAVAACRDRSYDLVLMDVQMPEVDGLEATRRIRQLSTPQPVVVAMTANAMEGDRATCLNAGMDEYIPKPIKIEDLQRVVSLPLRPSGR
ncbi:MAG: response regulator [Opitutaceae bacterium]|nr:response regulator [Opitutaceae bacterium]